MECKACLAKVRNGLLTTRKASLALQEQANPNLNGHWESLAENWERMDAVSTCLVGKGD